MMDIRFTAPNCNHALHRGSLLHLIDCTPAHQLDLGSGQMLSIRLIAPLVTLPYPAFGLLSLKKNITGCI